MEISKQSVRNNLEIVEFLKANHSTDNYKNSRSKIKWNVQNSLEKENNKIWIYLTRLPSFSEIQKNAVSSITGYFKKFKSDFLLNVK